MASELKVDKFTGVTTAGSIDVTGEGNSTTTNLQQGLCKVWINYNMANSTSIYDSFNIASITDNTTGDASFVYTNNMNNDDYAQTDGTGDENEQFNNSRALAIVETGRKTTSGTRFDTGGQTVNASYDFKENCIVLHGDLA